MLLIYKKTVAVGIEESNCSCRMKISNEVTFLSKVFGAEPVLAVLEVAFHL